MSHGEKKNIRIKFLGLTAAEEQQIRKFLQHGVIKRQLFPLTISKSIAGSEKREDFRVAFPDSKITLKASGDAAGTNPPSVDCKVINMSAGGFMVSTREIFQFRSGEEVEFILNFMDPGRRFKGTIEGISQD